ncbi:MAG: mechanosensitive ion channel domain-containing protein [Chloroflexota bacterium]
MISELFQDPVINWAVLLAIALPILILALGEVLRVAERQGSPTVANIQHIRTITIPLFVIWAVLFLILQWNADLFIVQFLASLLILSAAYALLNVSSNLITASKSATSWLRHIPGLALQIPRLVIIIGATFLLVENVWGFNLSNVTTAFGIGSAVIALALQGTAGGIASGLLVLADQPFQTGDWISIDGIDGRVVDVNWRTTRIVTKNQDMIIIPNAQIADTKITNYNRPSYLHRILVDIDVAFANTPTNTSNMLLRAVDATPGILSSPAPTVRVTRVDDPLMGYQIVAFIDDFAKREVIISELRSRIWYQTQRDDVSLPSPAYDIFHWDGPTVQKEGEVTQSHLAAMLKEIPTFNLCDNESLEVLAKFSTTRLFRVDETILNTGLNNHEVCIIRQGRARVTTPNVDGAMIDVDELVTGDFVGLGDAVQSSTMPLVIEANTDCEVIIIQRFTVFEIATRIPEFSATLERINRRRTQRVNHVLQIDSANRGISASSAAQPSTNGLGEIQNL